MKSSEKKLVGIAMTMGGIALVVACGLPQFDAFMANLTQAGTLKADLASSETQKENLNVQISLLEKNINIPSYIKVKTFTNDTEASATKELLDHVVNVATNSGNKFISLTPVEVEPFIAPKPKPKEVDANGSPIPPPPPPDPTTEEGKAALLKAAMENEPPLVTKGYEFTVRGTYDTLQSFLRAMDKQTLILDMLNFDLENEAAGATATTSSTEATFDPSMPLRLKITLRLALQRLGSEKTPTK